MRRFCALAIGLALLLATPGVANADSTNRQQAIQTVISRALTQRGVPFLYGGGDVAGPTRGTGLNATIVGFDASGLMVYAFAGAGIKMPRTSTDQFKASRKVLPAQALPGDLIFFGPDGSQSVAMFLGNGQMLEATEPSVVVSPVRTTNMTPYLGRIIER